MGRDIQARTFTFGVRIVRLSYHLSDSKAGRILGGQVLRSGTSVGANVEEASAALTKKDFIYKICLALKEARETHYWLRMIAAAGVVAPNRLADMMDEADQITRILGAIASKAKGRRKEKTQNAK